MIRNTRCCLLVTLLVGFAMVVTSTSRRASAAGPETRTLRVMTYNIHHGEGTDGVIDLDRLAQVIRDADPDLVALQEVDVGVERSRGLDIPKEFERRTGLHSVFSKNIDYQGGEYGNAILSRFEIGESSNLHYKMIRRDEQRGLLSVVVDVDGHKVVFASTHLDFRPDDSERLQNAGEIEALRKAHENATMIVCGDFNDFPDKPLHRRLKRTFSDSWEQVGRGDGFTFSSTKPNRRIDYVFVTPSDWLKPKEAHVGHGPASDHLPLVVTFEYDPASGGR